MQTVAEATTVVDTDAASVIRGVLVVVCVAGVASAQLVAQKVTEASPVADGNFCDGVDETDADTVGKMLDDTVLVAVTVGSAVALGVATHGKVPPRDHSPGLQTVQTVSESTPHAAD